MPSDRPHDDQEGYIVSGGVYSLDALRARLKLGSAALRQARRNGLAVRKIGRCCFVLGKDLIEFLEKQEP